MNAIHIISVRSNRFFDHRGKSTTIYSNNTTNFAGDQRCFHKMYQLFQSTDHQNVVITSLSDKGVEWNNTASVTIFWGFMGGGCKIA